MLNLKHIMKTDKLCYKIVNEIFLKHQTVKSYADAAEDVASFQAANVITLKYKTNNFIGKEVHLFHHYAV